MNYTINIPISEYSHVSLKMEYMFYRNQYANPIVIPMKKSKLLPTISIIVMPYFACIELTIEYNP